MLQLALAAAVLLAQVPPLKESIGVMTRVDEGDYVHCILKPDKGEELDLWHGPKYRGDCKKLIGKRVKVKYSVKKEHVPEAGGTVEMLLLESAEVVKPAPKK